MMRIRKTGQTTPTQAQISDTYSTSTTDGYSANYINTQLDKLSIKSIDVTGTTNNYGNLDLTSNTALNKGKIIPIFAYELNQQVGSHYYPYFWYYNDGFVILVKNAETNAVVSNASVSFRLYYVDIS